MATAIPIKIGRVLFPSLSQAQMGLREEIKARVTDADGHWLYGEEFESRLLTQLLKSKHPDIRSLGIHPQIFRVEPPLPGQERSGYRLLVQVPGSPDGWITVGWSQALRPSASRLYTQLNHALRRSTMEWIDGERSQPCAHCGVPDGVEIHHESPSFQEMYAKIWPDVARDRDCQSLLQWSRLSAFWANEAWNPYHDIGSHPTFQRFKALHDAGHRLPLCRPCHLMANAAQRARMADLRDVDPVAVTSAVEI